MAFTASDVKTLRERTGCGMMDCKKALTDANGDMDKAIEILREKGLATAAKKAGRIASEGIVKVYMNDAKTVSVLLEVNSETDFVAKNSEFQDFVDAVAKVVADTNPADVDALKATKIGDATVEETLTNLIAKIGENMNIRRFARFEGNVCSYSHGGGRIGVIVKAEAAMDDAAYEAARDVAMQVAAINPLYLSKEVVPAADVENEKRIIMAQIKEDPKNANKPENIIEKMVDGKINKFFEQNCLLQQEFVKDSDQKVEKYLASKGVKLIDFVRFEKGEGLEKKEENFADEIAKMVQ
ncbi:MAG: elongation factor Ts [Clostridia bacterium]|nr:elongation factor Ts [Clostridia bacterium]MBQ3554503.1 elongation factor Ts [Clostridia bacterium]